MNQFPSMAPVQVSDTRWREVTLSGAQVREAIRQYIIKNSRGAIPPQDARMEVNYAGARMTWEERDDG